MSRGIIDRTLDYLATWLTAHNKAIVHDTLDGVKQTYKSVNVTSNSSGLINLTDQGVSQANAWGITVSCSTSNYRVSTPILWSNGDYYVTLFAWNNATAQASKSVRLLITWFHT